MGFGYILLHFTSRFATFCLVFWCTLPCVLVQNTLRFGAYCSAFCCKMRCNIQRLNLIFLSLRMQIWENFSSKRNAKA